ncbi:hypothetical protein ACFWVC_26075 [Streptomyces sp. NPDC058691]|uniref:hypothetical protein n=1 Tax=Streptomyces sp. NPDC058691 TaxID=3346601 RepID=UPI00365CF3A8
MITKAVRLARVDTRPELGAALLMMLSYPCVMVAALLPNLWFFAAAVTVGYVADWFLTMRGVYLLKQLSRARAGLSIRFLARELMVILFLARTDLANDSIYYAAIVCFLLFYALQAPHSALLTLIRNRRRLPFATRNIDLSGLRIPDAPSPLLTRRAAEKMLHLDVAAVAGLLVSAGTDRPVFGFVGGGITLGLGVLYTAALVPYLRGRRLPAGTDTALAFMDGRLDRYKPTTVLYFSGSKDSAYQVNMWLDTMARLDGRPLVILRERFILPQLADTSVPVLCVPGAVHLMNMDLSTVRVALYPANVGKNIHMLRVPHIKHVFIGHGDSDKLASVNPYSKVYDEVWTAGKAGRDRYALADVGVRDDDIVEVGRPQLSRIGTWSGVPAGRIPTVLYAPTWEGWTDDPGNTSLILAGENIVRRLVEAPDPVRVLYKPHPFTGSRNPRAKQAHERVVALLEAAAARRAALPEWSALREGTAAARAEAQAELTRIEARLAALADTGRPGADDAEASRDTPADPAREAETARLREEWNAAYWRSFDTWEHRVVTGPMPHLYDCFNVSDAMVSDISSVVSDFIASGKPYAVTDSGELGEAEFKRQNTAVRAALILDNAASQTDRLLAALRGAEHDPLLVARKELKEYLLGPDEPTSMVRFDDAVRSLAAKADARLARLPQDGSVEGAEDEFAAMIPAQRAEDEFGVDVSLGTDPD